MPEPSPLILLDGGLGTTLADRYNCIFNDDTPLWSSQLLITSPSTLLECQSAFANAGADVILSATYQASFEGFAKSGVGSSEAGQKMRDGVRIARKAFGDKQNKGKVALSLGAYGATMIPSQEYSGRYDQEHKSVEQLWEWHTNRIEAFCPVGKGEEGKEKDKCWDGVDLVAFETLPRIEEVTAVREVMGGLERSLGKKAGKEFWISCVFPGEGNCLPDGTNVKEVVTAMLGKVERGRIPMGVGFNCTKIWKVEGLIGEFEREIKLLIERGELDEWPSLVVYPDGTNGEVYNTTTKEWEKIEGGAGEQKPWDEQLSIIMNEARRRGLWKSIYVGGCCKATPDDIAKLRKRIGEVKAN